MYQEHATVNGRRRINADARVRAALGLLVDQKGPELSIFAWELGELANTQREHASRSLARLQREGIVKRTGLGRITVLDREALR